MRPITNHQFRAPAGARAACAGFLAVILILLASGAALAHPLGNFTINRYSKLTATPRDLRVTYVVDMAEISAYAERRQIDADGDDALSADELAAYREAKSAELADRLALRVGGERIPLLLRSGELTFPPGQAGLSTLRLVLHLQAAAPEGGSHKVEYADANYADRLGWQEIVVAAADGAAVSQSTAPTQDISRELTSYPADLLSNPPQMKEAAFVWQPAAGSDVPSAAPQTAPAGQGRPTDPFADLVAIPQLGLGSVLLAILAAAGWGALHALSPGHGKTLVAAYLVGAQGTARHALFLGLATTVTHTAGVFALGFATLALSHFILAERLYPWLSAASGVLVVLIGLSLVRTRWLRGRVYDHGHDHGHAHSHDGVHYHSHDEHSHDRSHDRSHDHGHEHGHEHANEHAHDHGHTHVLPGVDGQPVTWRSLLALGVSGGLLPCPSALVLMLGAISLNRIGFGLLLIVAFSMGLAGVLTLFGILLVRAGKLFERLPEGSRLLRLAPAASALFITGAGLFITVQALAQTGLWRVGA